jgi:hypothetical protein
MDVTANTVRAASNGSIIIHYQDEDDEYGMLVTWSYLGKTRVTHSTINPVWTALGSNTSFRGKVQRLSATSMTRAYGHAQVFLSGAFEKLRKTTISFVMSVLPSICPLEVTRLPLDGFSLNMIFNYFAKNCREKFTFLYNRTRITVPRCEDH